MSVFSFIKSLFGKNEDNKKAKEVKVKASVKFEKSKQTSSDNAINENGVSGIKSSEPITKSSNDEVKPPVEEVNTSTIDEETKLDDSIKEPEVSQKEIINSEDTSEELVKDEISNSESLSENEEVSEEKTVSVEETEVSNPEESSEEEIDEVKISVESEDNSEDENEMDNERDNMTLLKDNDI